MEQQERLPNDYLKKVLFDLDGPLAIAELLQIYELAFSAPADCTFVECGGGSGQITCALALGCRGTSKKVITLFPAEIMDAKSEQGRMFALWHRSVIRKHLVPYVSPVPVDKTDAVSSALSNCEVFVEVPDPLYPALSVNPQRLPMQQLKYGAKMISVGAHG